MQNYSLLTYNLYGFFKIGGMRVDRLPMKYVGTLALRMSCRIYASGGISLNTWPKLTDSQYSRRIVVDHESNGVGMTVNLYRLHTLPQDIAKFFASENLWTLSSAYRGLLIGLTVLDPRPEEI